MHSTESESLNRSYGLFTFPKLYTFENAFQNVESENLTLKCCAHFIRKTPKSDKYQLLIAIKGVNRP